MTGAERERQPIMLENLIVFIIVGLALLYVVRRFITGARKKPACGCDCQGCQPKQGPSRK